jgi:hypothetical protein
MNPYIRAVSIYRFQTSHNLSFRKFLKQLLKNQVKYFSEFDNYHYHPQYIEGEENIITKYIKINENETYTIEKVDGTFYTLDPNKYSSIHHGKKQKDVHVFCGDMLLNDVKNNLPSSYKYFYDDEIKLLVEKNYKEDIEKYGFTFDFE